MSKQWSSLNSGDIVRIIAPASMVEEPVHNLEQINVLLKSWHLKMKVSDIIFGQDPLYPSLANTDDKRFKDFIDALEDVEVKAIWCIRGGYGTIRLIELLQAYNFSANIKPKCYLRQLFY